jgi:ABC-type polysaccharide/polyol phosphate export permease
MLLNVKITIGVLLFTLALVPVTLFAIGASLMLSALTIKKRDLLHIVPFFINFSIWFTPQCTFNRL